MMAVMGDTRGRREFAAAIEGLGTTGAAKALQVAPSMVTRLRSGERLPGRALSVRIAAVLGVQPEAWDDVAGPDTGDAA
jgi:plasmid maintenance system antidote protein VapI